jgi:hypothetical protein
VSQITIKKVSNPSSEFGWAWNILVDGVDIGIGAGCLIPIEQLITQHEASGHTVTVEG